MTVAFINLPGRLRLAMELEFELSRQYWLETQAELMEDGSDIAAFDAFAWATENAWCLAAEILRTKGGQQELSAQLAAGTLAYPALDRLAPRTKKRLLDDIASTLARFECESVELCHDPREAPAFLSELAGVHASRAGLTRFFQCSHFSQERPSARTTMLLDPAINFGDLLDSDQEDEGRALIQIQNSLMVVEDDLDHAFSPVRVSAVRPRIFHDRAVSAPRRGRSSAKFRSIAFAELGEQMLADRPHLSSLDTPHSTAGLTWSKSYQLHFAGFLKLLIKWFGSRPVASLEESDWRKFFAFLSRLPKTHHKSKFDADKSLEEIAEAAARKVQLGKLAPDQIGIGATATNRNVSLCRTLYSYLSRHVETPQIHWALFECPKPKPTRDRGYTLEEMEEIFCLPVFTGRQKANGPIEAGDFVWHNASYWVLLFAAYSGARVGEICGLRVQDVKEREGIWFVELRDNELRNLKRTASFRDLPVHPELIRLGFLAFVAAIKETGEWRLFPELVSMGRPITSGFQDLIGTFVKRRLSFMEDGELCHPIRHFVSEELRLAEIPLEVRQALLGHLGAEPLTERLGSLPNLKRVQEAILRLPLLTGQLQRHPIRLHPENLRTRRTRPDLKRDRQAIANQLKLKFEAEGE